MIMYDHIYLYMNIYYHILSNKTVATATSLIAFAKRIRNGGFVDDVADARARTRWFYGGGKDKTWGNLLLTRRPGELGNDVSLSLSLPLSLSLSLVTLAVFRYSRLTLGDDGLALSLTQQSRQQRSTHAHISGSAATIHLATEDFPVGAA